MLCVVVVWAFVYFLKGGKAILLKLSLHDAFEIAIDLRTLGCYESDIGNHKSLHTNKRILVDIVFLERKGFFWTKLVTIYILY